MKTKPNFLLIATLAGGILFNLLFWSEDLALNLLLYSIFIILVTFINPEIAKNTKLKVYALAHLLAAVLVIINNSDLSIISYFFSMILFVGYAHYPKIRSVYAAILATFLQVVSVPASLVKRLSDLQIGKFNLKPIFRPIKYIILPFFIVLIFTGIYSASNEVFAHYVDVFFSAIGNFLNQIFGFIFSDLNLPRFFHACLGILLTGGLLITFYDRSLENSEAGISERFFRKRRIQGKNGIWYEVSKAFSSYFITKKMALKTEYVIGMISFICLNLLLVCLNAIDISTLWFGYKPTGNFSSDLHQGTNSLIFSIILAMAVILYFFRGNLNFYHKSKTLKFLAYAWMVQNFILIISVFIRDGYYIEFHGLTHKRIGVAVFGLLCIVGLATVYIKVAQQKTLFYLFKVNGNIWYALLLAFSIFNWDAIIVKYNLSQSDKIVIDMQYLLSLSSKTLPLLDQNRAKLLDAHNGKTTIGEVSSNRPYQYYTEQLDRRIADFKGYHNHVSWLSWNLQDWKTAKYFGIEK